MSSADNLPHRRRNPLTGEWVTVSPQRVARPWQGEETAEASTSDTAYDPECYLCPGNTRVTGACNPDYAGPWAFDNDFPALHDAEATPVQSELLPVSGGDPELFTASPVAGRCRVLCYHPDHRKTLSTLSRDEASAVVALWVEEVRTLRLQYQWVQVFENRGAAMGCSNPHPHGQIWAVDSLPNEAVKELAKQEAWLDAHGSVLLQVYREQEAALGDRLVLDNTHWTAVVPYWAVWPFETLVLPKRHIEHLDGLQPDEQQTLAELLGTLMRGYDALFNTPCPYTMGWHGAPGTEDTPAWQLHAHIYPPLLRSASVRKHMVGYEMLSEVQRDLTPESAAARLRDAVAGVMSG